MFEQVQEHSGLGIFNGTVEVLLDFHVAMFRRQLR